ARLAGLEVDFTKEKARVDSVQAELFKRLRPYYQKRDQLKLKCQYFRKFLDSLIRGNEEQAEEAKTNYQQARDKTDRDYEEAAESVAEKKNLSEAEEAELAGLWKKLVKIYHPDRYGNEPKKQATYDKLTKAINNAKDNADIKTLREIANDPEEFIRNQGWEGVDFSETEELNELKRLYELLEIQIVSTIEVLNQLRQGSDYELMLLVEKRPAFLDELTDDVKKRIEAESEELAKQSEKLSKEIEEINGEPPEWN
ncbi:MAG: exonuclease, partial [Isosphaeraceae bacterium]